MKGPVDAPFKSGTIMQSLWCRSIRGEQDPCPTCFFRVMNARAIVPFQWYLDLWVILLTVGQTRGFYQAQQIKRMRRCGADAHVVS